MASFTVVGTGNPTLASDINQLINAFNGTVNSQPIITAPPSLGTPLIVTFSVAPTSDTNIIAGTIAGNTTPPITMYIRSSDGFGGIKGGNQASGVTATLFATATGWTSSVPVIISGQLTATTVASNTWTAQTGSTVSINTGNTLAANTIHGNTQTGTDLTVNSLIFPTRTITRIGPIFGGQGTVSGASHGLGVTPSMICIFPVGSTGPVGIVGYDDGSLNSSTVNIRSSNAAQFWAAFAMV